MDLEDGNKNDADDKEFQWSDEQLEILESADGRGRLQVLSEKNYWPTVQGAQVYEEWEALQ